MRANFFRSAPRLSQLSAVLAIALASATSAARASEDATARDVDPEAHDHVDQAISIDLGFASAVGYAGIAYSMTPLEQLRLELGAGWGATGAQLSLMPKWIFNRDHNVQLLLGVGPSLGLEPLNRHDANSELHRTGVSTWLNAELGLEHRFTDTHVMLTFAAGIAVGLSGNYLLTQPLGSNTFGMGGSVFPATRFGMGYAF